MNNEIDELKSIDTFHKIHFANNRPSVDKWRQQRLLYIESPGDAPEEELNQDTEYWFNDLKVSIYMREPKNQNDLIDPIKERLIAAVPGHDFENLHVHTIHDDETCLDGDIFSHSKAWRFSEIEKVERANKHTENDLLEGKIRQGDHRNNDLYESEGEQHEGDVELEEDNEAPADENNVAEPEEHNTGEEEDVAENLDEQDMEMPNEEDMNEEEEMQGGDEEE